VSEPDGASTVALNATATFVTPPSALRALLVSFSVTFCASAEASFARA
jgi:hypothetical protein